MYLSRVKQRERRERMLRDFKLGVFSMFVLVILVVSFCWDRQTLPEPLRTNPAHETTVTYRFGPARVTGPSSAAITAPVRPEGTHGTTDEAPAAQAPSPLPRSTPEPAVRIVRHRIRRNETLVKLARRYYAGDWEKWTLIRDANPGINPKKLRIGRVLNVPVTIRRAGRRVALRP